MPEKSIADIISQGGYGVLGRLAQILTSKADLVDGKIKIDEIPSDTIGTVIIQSPEEPKNPREGDLWIDTSET
jgi:hypothetical protein